MDESLRRKFPTAIGEPSQPSLDDPFYPFPYTSEPWFPDPVHFPQEALADVQPLEWDDAQQTPIAWPTPPDLLPGTGGAQIPLDIDLPRFGGFSADLPDPSHFDFPLVSSPGTLAALLCRNGNPQWSPPPALVEPPLARSGDPIDQPPQSQAEPQVTRAPSAVPEPPPIVFRPRGKARTEKGARNRAKNKVSKPADTMPVRQTTNPVVALVAAEQTNASRITIRSRENTLSGTPRAA